MRAAFLFLLITISANAQNFALIRSEIKTGGISTGGAFSIHGTIFPQDTKPRMTNSAFTVEGAFVPLTFKSPAPEPAELQLAKLGNNILLTWPDVAVGYLLESTYALGPFAVWNILNPSRTNQSSLTTTLLPVAQTPQIYRLRHAGSLP